MDGEVGRPAGGVSSPDEQSPGPGLAGYSQNFLDLMRWRVREVLLVSSHYDSFLFDEDGQLYGLIQDEYLGLSMSHSPEIVKVPRAADALAMLAGGRQFDLIITTPHIEDSHPLQFARQVRELGVTRPITLLAFDNRELTSLLAQHDTTVFDRIFIWQGDFRLIIAIIKDLEDRMNVEHDTESVGVQSILLIEDNMRFYSSLLPEIYTEILKQSKRLISEGKNISQRYLRMRARPKILFCTDYESAAEYFSRYGEAVLGVISDIDFPRGGEPDPRAGIDFVRHVRGAYPDIPVLLQSYYPEVEREAAQAGAAFVLKASASMLEGIKSFMNGSFSFGDFIFRTEDGREVGRANDLRGLEEQLRVVPPESIRFHGERNHFSNWLKARTEFWLADQLRPRRVSDYGSLEELRDDLILRLKTYRRNQARAMITDFERESFDPTGSFARIGGGSIGGKARGMGFLNMLLNADGMEFRHPGVRVFVPCAVVVGTDVFDRYLDMNDLRAFALDCDDDEAITNAFVDAEHFPPEITARIGQFLEIITDPIAVRSSSLLEDSQYLPFAGVYETYMLPNNNPDVSVRLQETLAAIKRVYASAFYRKAKEYMKATAYRLEEEKMAVAIQKIVGSRWGKRYYPEIAGVGRSYNFYPIPPQEPEDGIVSIALGLGKMVVEGGLSVKFSPRHPRHLPQFFTVEDTLENNQHHFFALDMNLRGFDSHKTYDSRVGLFDLSVAEEDGSLSKVGSTYSPENDAVYEGISRPGMRLVTFGSLLQEPSFPFPEIMAEVLRLGSDAMGTAVEIEFAVNLADRQSGLVEVGLLQLRPMVVNREPGEIDDAGVPRERILCRSDQVLGNGVIDDIRDIVYVDFHLFERGKSREVAQEVERFNARLTAEGKPYLLVGVGRWGSLDPWLGIPVRWDQIGGARVIVETGFRDMDVVPSQGSHFFQNLTAFMTGYLCVGADAGTTWLDWEWLAEQKPAESLQFTRHIRLERPLTVRLNNRERKGVILKPE
jgi:CheY-like chemotaxis protein